MVARHPAPHLLYVAWGFPPSRSGGVYRALATANAFARAGWRVSVLTASREAIARYIGTDPSLEDHIDPSIKVLRLPFRWPAMETDIRTFSRLRASSPQRWRSLELLREKATFPEHAYGTWRRTLERAARRVHEQDPVDLVVATANPHVDFTAAWALHRADRVPFVMDYRDAWLLDVFDGGRLHSDGSRAARWERRLVGGAREVWFVNEPIRAWHQARYPRAAARMHVVANGYDPELAAPTLRSASSRESGLVFGYLGTVSPKVPLAEMIEGWRWARAHDDVVARGQIRLHGYLGFYAAPRADLSHHLAEAAQDEVLYAGPVAKKDVAAVYDSFDVLLLAIGAGRYVTSGKVYEYLATGLPIVSVHDPGNAASDVLRGYPLWFPVSDLEPATVGRAIVQAARAALQAGPQLRQLCLDHAAAFARDRQLLPRVRTLSVEVGGLPPDPEPPLAAASSGGAHPGLP